MMGVFFKEEKNGLNYIFVCVLVLFVNTSCNSGSFAENKRNRLIKAKCNEYFDTLNNFSGNVLVAQNDEILYSKSFGFANEELNVKNNAATKFRIGSITKTFTSMAIMILYESGKLKFEDSISKHLSNIPKKWEPITIHQLLTHTAGFKNSWMMDGFVAEMMIHKTQNQIIEKYKNEPLLFEPGTDYNYSSYGYYILAEIVESTSKMPFEQFLRQHIFDVLGMHDTGSDYPDSILLNRACGYEMRGERKVNTPFVFMPRLTGGGNLYSTTYDMFLWHNALANNTLISEETKSKMFKIEKSGYSYGWEISNDTILRIGHLGGVPGFLAKFDRYPELGIVVVVLSNNRRLTNPEIEGEFSDLVVTTLYVSRNQ